TSGLRRDKAARRDRRLSPWRGAFRLYRAHGRGAEGTGPGPGRASAMHRPPLYRSRTPRDAGTNRTIEHRQPLYVRGMRVAAVLSKPLRDAPLDVRRIRGAAVSDPETRRLARHDY